MKKILSLALVLVFALSCFVACGGNGDENTYTLSIAVDEGFKTVSSKGATTNIALALVTDADGKIVAARFDSAEASLSVTDGAIASTSRINTKVEQGDSYAASRPMPAGSWQNQAKAFEDFIVGKTAADVAALDTSEESVKNETNPLVAGCTMTTSTPVFQALVAKAFAYERKVTFTTSETVSLGLAIDAKVTGTDDVTAEGAKVTVAADYAAVAIAGGKVVASMIDSCEASYTFAYNEDTEKYAATASYKGTKNEQGDAYDINDYVQPMPSGRWYAQAQAFANTAVGKTVAELNDLSTEKIEGSCSIYTGGYKACIVRAAGYAR